MSELRLPYPHRGQRLVRSQARRFNMLICGRRWRKTTLAMAIAVESAAKGFPIIWGAPTYDQVMVCWNETKRAAEGVAEFNMGQMSASFPSGGVILYRSLNDHDHSRGWTAAGIVVDEVADVRPQAWHGVLRPMLMDTEGWAWLIGTPRGMNWVAAEFARWSSRPDCKVWQVPTVGCEIVDETLVRKPHPFENPNIKFREIQDLFELLPRRTFEEEILAEFLDDAGGVFRGVSQVTVLEAQLTPRFGQTVVFGIDWGQKNDWTVVSIMDVDTKQQLVVDRFNKIGWKYQRDRIAGLIQLWRPALVVVEANSIGGPNLEELALQTYSDGTPFPVVGVDVTGVNKGSFVQGLALAIERSAAGYPDGVRLLRHEAQKAELQAYEMKALPSGRFQFSAPDGMHDDCVIALMLNWYGVNSASFVPIMRQARVRW